MENGEWRMENGQYEEEEVNKYSWARRYPSLYYTVRKKKCIRYKEAEGEENNADTDNHVSDDNLGSCGSVDEAKTPEDDTESLNQSLSSPGCLSGLSSLQSPSTSLASPLNLLTSPSTPNTMNNSQEQQQQHHHHQQQQQQHSLFPDASQNNSSVSNSQQMNNLDRHRKPSASNINSHNNNNINSNLNGSGVGLNRSAMTTSTSLATNIVPSSSIVTPCGQIKTEKVLHGMGASSSLLSGRLGPLMGANLIDRTSPQQRIGGTDLLTSTSSLSLINHPLLCNKSLRTVTSSGHEKPDDIVKRIQSPTNARVPQIIDDKTTIDKFISTQRNQQTSNNNINNVQLPASSIGGPFSSDIYFEKAIRNPVGANPRDINNPLSVNQLTKRDYTTNNNSPPSIQLQSMQTLQQHQHHHQTISTQQQHHLHNMINASSPSSTVSSSSTSSSSLSSSSTLSSTTSSNEIQTAISITSGYSNLTTTTVISTDHHFSTPALTHQTNTVQQQNQQENHQQYHQVIPSTSVQQQQQSHHQHVLSLSQHLQHFSHHFPVVSVPSTTQSSDETAIKTSSTNNIGGTASTSTTVTTAHHLSAGDNDNGAISVT